MCSRKFESYCFRMQTLFASDDEDPEKRKKYDSFLPSGYYDEPPVEVVIERLKGYRTALVKMRLNGNYPTQSHN